MWWTQLILFYRKVNYLGDVNHFPKVTEREWVANLRPRHGPDTQAHPPEQVKHWLCVTFMTHYFIVKTFRLGALEMWRFPDASDLTLILFIFLVAQMVKTVMQETWVQSLGWEDPLEEGMATYFIILAWRIRMDRGTWWVTVHGVTKSWT